MADKDKGIYQHASGKAQPQLSRFAKKRTKETKGKLGGSSSVAKNWPPSKKAVAHCALFPQSAIHKVCKSEIHGGWWVGLGLGMLIIGIETWWVQTAYMVSGRHDYCVSVLCLEPVLSVQYCSRSPFSAKA